MINWDWLSRNAAQIWAWTLDHIWLAAAPTVLGLLLALPLGAVAHRYRWSYATLITLAGLLYTIPSIALFVVLPGLLGIPQLGQLFTVGFQLDFFTPIIAGIVLCLVLAAIFDVTIQLIVRLSTPWTRAVKH